MQLLHSVANAATDDVVKALSSLIASLDLPPNSLYSIGKDGFQLDLAIVQSRAVLEELAKKAEPISAPALRAIVLFGMARGSIEDILVAVSLIKAHSISVDLRPHLHLFDQAIEVLPPIDPPDMHGFDKVLPIAEKTSQLPFLSSLDLTADDSLTVDDELNFYLHSQKHGLIKFNSEGVLASNENFKQGEKCTLALIND